jgi:hypothetical protein
VSFFPNYQISNYFNHSQENNENIAVQPAEVEPKPAFSKVKTISTCQLSKTLSGNV